MAYFKFGASLVIGRGIGYLVNEVDAAIADYKRRLKKAKMGAVIHGEPKLAWIAMLDKPYKDKVLSLRRKYNEILEETLTLHRNNYFINPAQAVTQSDYDRRNHLSSDGKVKFWRYINRKLQEFDKDQTPFKPTKVVSNMNNSMNEERKRFVLPRPPQVK